VVSAQGIAVPVTSVDQASAEFGIPAAIKIDVEGYEWHVLQGTRKTLASDQLQHAFVEIHFALLEARGLPMAGADIQKALADNGFKANYTDFSHLCASRM
jgi:hypothetical protein